jgi:Uma2 family endonuclease
MSAVNLIDEVATPAELIRHWTELGEDPESPDYYELNEYSEVILSPRPTNIHQSVAFEIALQLQTQFGPKALTEISVLTDRGVRVPDAIWMPEADWNQVKHQTPLSKVPAVCVEVMSPGNTEKEILMKVHAYLRGGASQVVIVDLQGTIRHLPDTNPLRIKLTVGP